YMSGFIEQLFPPHSVKQAEQMIEKKKNEQHEQSKKKRAKLIEKDNQDLDQELLQLPDYNFDDDNGSCNNNNDQVKIKTKKQRLEGNEEQYEKEEEPPEVKNEFEEFFVTRRQRMCQQWSRWQEQRKQISHHQARLQVLQCGMPWRMRLHAACQSALQAGDAGMSISVVQRAVQEREGDGGVHCEAQIYEQIRELPTSERGYKKKKPIVGLEEGIKMLLKNNKT
ncbi:MAG: hypothetical protein EZS28_032025, partial [Streblomastix strix]